MKKIFISIILIIFIVTNSRVGYPCNSCNYDKLLNKRIELLKSNLTEDQIELVYNLLREVKDVYLSTVPQDGEWLLCLWLMYLGVAVTGAVLVLITMSPESAPILIPLLLTYYYIVAELCFF